MENFAHVRFRSASEIIARAFLSNNMIFHVISHKVYIFFSVKTEYIFDFYTQSLGGFF